MPKQEYCSWHIWLSFIQVPETSMWCLHVYAHNLDTRKTCLFLWYCCACKSTHWFIFKPCIAQAGGRLWLIGRMDHPLRLERRYTNAVHLPFSPFTIMMLLFGPFGGNAPLRYDMSKHLCMLFLLQIIAGWWVDVWEYTTCIIPESQKYYHISISRILYLNYYLYLCSVTCQLMHVKWYVALVIKLGGGTYSIYVFSSIFIHIFGIQLRPEFLAQRPFDRTQEYINWEAIYL